MTFDDDKLDYSDFRPPPSDYALATADDVPDYIKGYPQILRDERAKARRNLFSVAPDFGIHPDELATQAVDVGSHWEGVPGLDACALVSRSSGSKPLTK